MGDGGTSSGDVDGDARCTASHATTHGADFVVQVDGSPFLSHVQKPPESVAKKDFVFPKKNRRRGEGGGGMYSMPADIFPIIFRSRMRNLGSGAAQTFFCNRRPGLF